LTNSILLIVLGVILIINAGFVYVLYWFLKEFVNAKKRGEEDIIKVVEVSGSAMKENADRTMAFFETAFDRFKESVIDESALLNINPKDVNDNVMEEMEKESKEIKGL